MLIVLSGSILLQELRKPQQIRNERKRLTIFDPEERYFSFFPLSAAPKTASVCRKNTLKQVA